MAAVGAMRIRFRAQPDESRAFAVDPAAGDAELVAQAKHDRAAFAALYRLYFDAVYRFCYRRLGGHDAAEDAAALVFVKALTSLPAFREGEGSFRAWLFTIAYRVVADEFRGRRPSEPIDAADWVTDPAPSPEEHFLAAEERDRLTALLARLPDDQRRVLELRRAGLSGAEIAQTLGRSHAAVKMLQSRAVARLRAFLTAECDATEIEVCRDPR
ncbi:MAG TPA: sigma-70 family RNA polymerase sigma factor [Thermomicrobiales bacterium]